MASIIPIQDLDPSSKPPTNRSIRAVVTLSWPYSSSTRQCALLLADPDFRLRSRKGQVRVVFRGPAARAVAERRLGIGDAVVLDLSGGKWVNEVVPVQTPGRSVGELEFGGALKFKLSREGAEDETVEVEADVANGRDYGKSKASEATPAKRLSAIENFRGSFGTAPEKSVGVYASPAFFRKSRFSELEGLNRLFGEDLDAQGSPRKKARVSIGEVRDWRVVSRTPSPVKLTAKSSALFAVRDQDVMDVDGETTGLSDSLSSSPTPAAAQQPRIIDFGSQAVAKDAPILGTQAAESASTSTSHNAAMSPLKQLATSALKGPNSPSQLLMAPPSLPRLKMPSKNPSPERSEADESEDPLTPRLQPISSTALPLPSPFPAEIAGAVHFSRTREIPDTCAEDEIEISDVQTSRFSLGRTISDTYEEEVIVPSSPHPFDGGAQDDGLDHVDDIGVDDAYVGESLMEEDDEDNLMHMDDVEEEIDPGGLGGQSPSDEYDEVAEYRDSSDSDFQSQEGESFQPSREPGKLGDSEDDQQNDRLSSVPTIMSASQLLLAQLNAGEVEVPLELLSQTSATKSQTARPTVSTGQSAAQATGVPAESMQSSPTVPHITEFDDEELEALEPHNIKVSSPRTAAKSPTRPAVPILKTPAKAQAPTFESGWGRHALDFTAPLSVNTHWGLPSAETPVVKSREATQATPQSERDRALKGTFRSLFGFQPSPSPTKDVQFGFARDEEAAKADKGKAIIQLDGALPDLEPDLSGYSQDALEFARDEEAAEASKGKTMLPLDGALPDLEPIFPDDLQDTDYLQDELSNALPIKAETRVFDPLLQPRWRNPQSSAHVIDLCGSSSDVEDGNDDEQIIQPGQPSNELMIVSPEVAALEVHPTPRLDVEAVIGTPVPDTAALDPFILVGPEEQRRRSEHAVLDEEGVAARERSRLVSPLFSRDDADAVMDEAYGPASPGQYSGVHVLLQDDDNNNNNNNDSVASSPFLSQQDNTLRALAESEDDDGEAEDAEPTSLASAGRDQAQEVQQSQLHAANDQSVVPTTSSFQMLSSSPTTAPAVVHATQQESSDDIEMLDMSQAESQYWTQPSQSQRTIQPSQQSPRVAVDDSVDSPQTSLAVGSSRPVSRDTVEDCGLMQASQVSRVSAREALDPRVSYMGQRQTIEMSQEARRTEDAGQAAAIPQYRRISDFDPSAQEPLSSFPGIQQNQEKRDDDMFAQMERQLDDSEAAKLEAVIAEAARAHAVRAETIRSWVANAEADASHLQAESASVLEEDVPADIQADGPAAPTRPLGEAEAANADAARAKAAIAKAAGAMAARAGKTSSRVANAQADAFQAHAEAEAESVLGDDTQAVVEADAQVAPTRSLRQTRGNSLQSKDDVLKRLFGIGTASQSAASDAGLEPSQQESFEASQADVSYSRLPITPSFSQSQSARFETQLPNLGVPGDVPGALPLTPPFTQQQSDLQVMTQEVYTQETNLDQSQPHMTMAEQTAQVDNMEAEKQDAALVNHADWQAQGDKPQASIQDMSMENESDVAPSKELPPPETPRRKSLRTRLSNVPDVISAWFSPKRSSAIAPITEEPISSEKHALEAASPARRKTSDSRNTHAYFTKLASLERHLNPRNSQSYGSQSGVIDVLAVVTDDTKGPQRAKSGPRDYFTVFHITDRSLPALTNVSVEVYRPWKAVLPAADIGDVVMLRSFAVKSRHRKPYLLSTDASAWCVWRFAERAGTGGIAQGSPQRPRSSDGGVREEVKGPPIEYGDSERELAEDMRGWWVHLEDAVLASSGVEAKEVVKV